MKYIRTADGAILKHPHPNDEMFTSRYEIVMSASNIEKLCDLFIIILPKLDGLPPITYSFEKAKKIYKDFKQHNKEVYLYGLVLTDKGPKYVTKMNEKGELKLI